MINYPKVSIIIPVYNGSNYLKEAIDSALAQVYPNIEVIVVNDGSEDGGRTQAIIDSYGDKIRGFIQSNKGVGAALNLGIDQMTGEYFSWLSHDDKYTPYKVSSQMEKLKEIGDPKAIIYTSFKTISGNNEVLGEVNPGKMYDLVKHTHSLFPVFRLLINGCTLLIHKSHFQRVGGFRVDLKTTQDYDMWFKLFRGQHIIFFDQPEFLSRSHQDQESKRCIKFHIRECDALWADMLGSLTRKEIETIDDNAYLFYFNSFDFLSRRTLYYGTIQLTKMKAIEELRRLLLEGKKYKEIEKGQLLFDNDMHVARLLEHPEILSKTQKRILFLQGDRADLGGMNRATRMVTEKIAGEYEVLIGATSAHLPEGYSYDKGIHVFQIMCPSSFSERFSRLVYLLDVDLFIGSHNCLEYCIKLYGLMKGYGIKVVAWNHEDYFFPEVRRQYRVVQALRREVYRELDGVIWINQRSQEQYALEADNGIYLPNMIDEKESMTVENQKEPYALLAVGRFDDQVKRLDKLLEVFAKLLTKDLNYKLYVAGKYNLDMKIEDETKTIRQLMMQLGLSNKQVIFTGELNDIKDYYKKAQILLVTSSTEGFGLVIPEAAYYGTPTIAFSNGGADTIIENGISGFIIKEDNIAEMANRIIEVTQTEVLYKKLQEGAKERLKNFYSQKIIGEWLGFIEKLLETSREEKKKVSFIPKVSIIIPVYNGSNYLKYAIDSALAQDYENFEVVVVNDGSDDQGKTKEIALSYASKIRYFENSVNKGVASALNLGLEKMQGDYFSWLSHDDSYLPQKIASQIKLLEELGDPKTIIYSGYRLMDASGKPYYDVDPIQLHPKEKLEKSLFPLFRGIINGCTLLIHKEHFKRVGNFNTKLLSTQDYDLWFRMFRGAKIVCQNEINVLTRIHDERGSNKIPTNRQETNRGWKRRMHSVTIEEMCEMEGSPEQFYGALADFIGGFPNYTSTAEESRRLQALYAMPSEVNPKVSVIIPFYNRISLVAESIKSVMSQTYENLEILLINDGSTEEVSQVLQLVETDKRIRYFVLEHGGVSVARNKGIDEATGEYIAFLDADDLFKSTKIEKQLAFMKAHNYQFCHTSYEQIDSMGEKKGEVNSVQEMKGIVYPSIIYYCVVATPTVMVKKAALEGLRFKEGITVSQDICLWIDLAFNYELGGLDECLSQVRVDQRSTAMDESKVKKGALVVLNHLFANEEYLMEEEAIYKHLQIFTSLYNTNSYFYKMYH